MQLRENRSLLSQVRASLLKTAIFVVAMLAITGAVFSLFGTQSVFAQAQDFGLGVAQQIGLPTTDIRQIAVNVIRVLLGLLGLVALGIVLYAGFQWMTAGDNAEKVASSKKTLINGAIGLLIIVSAYAIVSFFFSAFGYGGLFGGGAVRRAGEPGGFGGALGNGPIQSHYPSRNAVDVPRNTSIIVTFKEAMNSATVISDEGNVEIVTREQYDAGGTLSPLTAITIGTADNKTFVFTPQQYLGSPDNATGYVVILGSDIKKLDGRDVFTGRFTDYIWSFEVSNKLDVVPPTVTSVIPNYSNPVTSESVDSNPHNNTVARNAIIQINFSEAVNPLAVTGEVKINNGVLSFNNITVNGLVTTNEILNTVPLTGRFEISNQYRTVEFTTDQECGVNSCGEKVYCLPGNAQLQVMLKSALLIAAANKNPDLPFLAAPVIPMNGVVDIANNSLDGNKNNLAEDNQATYNLNIEDSVATRSENPAGDNYQWGFYTNNTVDLVPPTVVDYSPVAKSVGVQPTQQLTATFDKYLSSSTIKPDAGYGDGYCGCTTSSQCNAGETCNAVKGYCENSDDNSRIVCHKHTDGAECKPISTADGADEDEALCIEHEHVALLQPIDQESIGYWMMTQNDPNPLVSRSTAIMDHVQLIKNAQYGAYYGSGIRDLFQNCYIPNAAPGCPRVGGNSCTTNANCAVNGVASVCQSNNTCSYVAGAEWLGADSYPSCDLSQSQIATYGSYNLGYATPVSQTNKTLLFPAFAWTKSVTALVSSLIDIDYFKDLPQKNVASNWLYFQQGTEQGSGDLYLISYVGKNDPSVATSGSHNITYTITSTNSAFRFSTGNVISSGTGATGSASGDLLALNVSLTWTDKTSAYVIYKLGSATEVSNINLQIVKSGDAVTQWQTIYPGGRQDMDQTTQITVNALDTQAPLVSSGDFKVQYSKVGDNYIINITLDANRYKDLAEAYLDWSFPIDITVLKQYNLSAQPMNDVGRNGDARASDSIWTYQFTISDANNAATAIAGSTVTLNHLSKDYAGNSVRLNDGMIGGNPTASIQAEISTVTP